MTSKRTLVKVVSLTESLFQLISLVKPLSKLLRSFSTFNTSQSYNWNICFGICYNKRHFGLAAPSPKATAPASRALPVVPAYPTKQLSCHVSCNSISQLIKGISRDLKNVLKYVKGTNN